jgi:hypothetical protein
LNFLDGFSKITQVPNFHLKNPSNWSRFVPCGRTVRHTDMRTLMIPFRNFENAPKHSCCYVLGTTGYILIAFLWAGMFTNIGYSVFLYSTKCNDFVECRRIRGFYVVRLLLALILVVYLPKITSVAGRHKNFAGEYWLMRYFAIYKQSNWIKVYEVLRSCNTSGRCVVCYTILVGKREWRKPLGDTCAYRRGDNIKMNFQYIYI